MRRKSRLSKNIVHGSKSSKYEQCVDIKLCIKSGHPNPWRPEYRCALILAGVKNVLKVKHHLVGSVYNISKQSKALYHFVCYSLTSISSLREEKRECEQRGRDLTLMSQPHCSTMGFSQCCLQGRKVKGRRGEGGDRRRKGKTQKRKKW